MKVLRATNLTILVITLGLLGGAEVLGAESGVLELSVVDASTGRAVPARVRIRDRSGADHVPAGSAVVPIARDKWFPAVSPVRMRLPAGAVSVRVERGLEYKPAKESITVRAGETVKHKVELGHWIDLRERGYVCGENHIHVPAEKLGAMLVAEDLDFGTSRHWWNGPRFEEQSGGDWQHDLKADSHVIPTSVRSEYARLLSGRLVARSPARCTARIRGRCQRVQQQFPTAQIPAAQALFQFAGRERFPRV